jgi:DNA-binding transcriptional LysR family regulator
MHNDPALNITLLKTFVAVAEIRNLTAAGAALGLSQPTVSQHLQRLEEYLGRPLLRRDTRPIKLTPAGEKLLGGLPDLLAGFEALLANVRAHGSTQRDVLRIAMSDSMSCVLGAEILALAGNLAKKLELRAGISPWIEESLRSGQCDLAIDCPPFVFPAKAGQHFLFHDPYVIVASRMMADVPLSRLIQEKPQVAFGRNSKFGTATAAIAAELGATEPARFSLDTTHSLLRFVQSGYGWAVTSAFCLLQAPNAIDDLVVHECSPQHARAFYLLGRSRVGQQEMADLATRVITVFRECVTGRWLDAYRSTATLLMRANADIRF